uniref:Uncharacterized protein n=1 Tax=Cyclopterus lumpus TaxID=8103 RepID=A0A8C2ZWK6_CYCLU
MIQDGMKKIKEFQKRKLQMEQELGDVSTKNTEHRENLNKMEFKFFQEKVWSSQMILVGSGR